MRYSKIPVQVHDRSRHNRWIPAAVVLCTCLFPACSKSRKVNSIGMELVRIESGTFEMGSGRTALSPELLVNKTLFPNGDSDEHPSHSVRITIPFYVSVFEVTNAQYEQFDPSHKKQRGRFGYSVADDEAVVFVSWNNAVDFCQWLSEKEGETYRLPTEAEWEYACRAGTTTAFVTGETLPSDYYNQPSRNWDPIPLKVGQRMPNSWGLHDMHGNVEEWCSDWYAPYLPDLQIDPVGPVEGDFKVTRGGSHSTWPYYLRSANRSGTLPEDKSWMVGFRVVQAEFPGSAALPDPDGPFYRQNVSQDGPSRRISHQGPYFSGPNLYVKIPPGSHGPLFSRHNHFSTITECPNGDLLAAWFSCESEMGRELSIAASRLAYGEDEWQPASVFWDAPDRNDHGFGLWNDGKGTLFHFNGLAARWRNLAVLLRKSRDNGVTWSPARLIYPDHDSDRNNMVHVTIFRAQDGSIVLPFDGRGGSVISISRDEGETWEDPGGNIRGTHGGVTQLKDGRLFAMGRHGAIDGRMPQSISDDMGKTWTYSPSPFQPISGGQRLVLLRLREGPLFFASFAKDMVIRDSSGTTRPVTGLFGAVSLDEGKTWPHVRLISDDLPPHEIETMDGHPLIMDSHRSERAGYCSVVQDRDGVIHLLSSRQHYAFNLDWFKSLPPPARPLSKPSAKALEVKLNLDRNYQPDVLPTQDKGWEWEFEGANCEESAAAGAEGSRLKIRTQADQQMRWRDQAPDGFAAANPKVGFTAEIKVQVLKSGANDRGFDLEIYDGFGSRYSITITERAVYWYEGLVLSSSFLPFEGFSKLASGLDNTDSPHRFRLAVRPDRVVQIYRDGELLGVREAQYRTPRDPYLIWGTGPEVEALVKSVSYDLGGPKQPE